jgi:hypothetical protein
LQDPRLIILALCPRPDLASGARRACRNCEPAGRIAFNCRAASLPKTRDASKARPEIPWETFRAWPDIVAE